MKIFAERLKDLRIDRGLSQNALGKKLGFKNWTIARWESEETIPNIESLKIIADFFNVTADYLIGREN